MNEFLLHVLGVLDSPWYWPTAVGLGLVEAVALMVLNRLDRSRRAQHGPSQQSNSGTADVRRLRDEQ